MAGVGSRAEDCTADDLLVAAVVNFRRSKFISWGKTGVATLTAGRPWGSKARLPRAGEAPNPGLREADLAEAKPGSHAGCPG